MARGATLSDVSMDVLDRIILRCPTSPGQKWNQIAVTSRNMNVVWHKMFRAVLRSMLPDKALSCLSVVEVRDILCFEDERPAGPLPPLREREELVARFGPWQERKSRRDIGKNK